jgi:SHS2 domain-containing protein
MEKYRILPHTADGKFRAFGATLEEAFAHAALALASLMWNWGEIAPAESIEIEVRGRDREQILYKFLEEVIVAFEIRRFLLGSVEGLTIDEEAGALRLRAVFRGDSLRPGTELLGVVKAVTYHEMKIENGCCGWAVQAVVDM